MITVDNIPVHVSWRGKWSAEVESLDGSMLITDDVGTLRGAAPRGFVKLARLVEIPDPECTCQPHDAQACPVCVAAARARYPEILPY